MPSSLEDVSRTLFLHLWPLYALVGLIVGDQLWRALNTNLRLARVRMPEIDRMTGEEFEQYLAILFSRLGYNVTRTGGYADYGADLIIEQNGMKAVVQAKRWNQPVGNRAIQEAAAAVRHYGCHRAMVVTNSVFTKNARKLAMSNDIILWDRQTLAKAVLRLQENHATSTTTGTTR